MIPRNGLLGFLVLLAGLAAGGIFSLAISPHLDQIRSQIPDTPSRTEIPEVSVTGMGIRYLQAEGSFREPTEADQLRVPRGKREQELFRLHNFYTGFYMNYFWWLDTGDEGAETAYKLALGQLQATLDDALETYGEDALLPARKSEDLQQILRIARQSDRTVRWAKVVESILIFLLVLGIPRILSDRGHKRFSGTLCFDSIFRPRLISGLQSWYGLKRMAMVLPVLYLFSLVLLFSFSSWKIPLLLGGLGLIPVILCSAVSAPPGRWPEVSVSCMALKIPVILLLLGAVAFRGPNFFWFRIGASELFRTLFAGLFFMWIFRKFHAAVILTQRWNSGSTRSRAAALAFLSLGIQFLATGTLLYCFGPEACLHALNRKVLLLPESLLALPARVPLLMVSTGGILSIAALFLLRTKRLWQQGMSSS